MDIFENIYGTLFDTDKTFSRLSEAPNIKQSALIIVCISTLTVLTQFNYSSNILNLFWLLSSLLGSIVGGIVSWIVLAGFFEFITGIFDRNGKFQQFLTLSAFSFLPWIFILPFELLKEQSYLGAFFGIIFEICIWIWCFKLLIYAVAKSYELTLTKAVCLLIIPFFAIIIAFSGISNFFGTLFNIFKL